MLYQIYALTVKEFKVLLNDRGALITLFVIPIVFIMIMSSAGIGGVRQGDDEPIEVVVINQDSGTLAAQAIGDMGTVEGIALVEQIDGASLTMASAEQLIVDGGYPLLVVFPADFTARVEAAATDPSGQAAVVRYVADPAASRQVLDPLEATISGFVQRTVALGQAPLRLQAGFDELVGEAAPEQAPMIANLGAAVTERMTDGYASGDDSVRFERSAPADFAVRELPTPAEQNVPGYTIFGVFFVMQTLAISLLREKQDGTFRRLTAAPLSRVALLLGKLVPYYLVNLIQVASMFAIGVLLFGMKLGHAPLGLVLVTMAAAAASTGLGLLIAALGKTAEQVSGIAALLSIVLAVIGGMMFPSFVMPQFMQTLSQFTPHAWALAGYQDVIVRGLGTTAVLTNAGMLLVFAAAFFGIAVWRFRFE